MKLETKNLAQRFVQLVQSGITSWLEAGKLVAEEMDKDPSFADRLVEQVPGLSLETVMRFNSIGKGLVVPELMLQSDSPGARRLLQMPIEIQKKYQSEPLAMLVPAEKGWQVLNVDVLNLTAAQVRQVFAGKRVRSEAAQRAWLEDESTKRRLSESEVNSPYVIRGGKLHITENCTFTRRDLAQILSKMED